MTPQRKFQQRGVGPDILVAPTPPPLQFDPLAPMMPPQEEEGGPAGSVMSGLATALQQRLAQNANHSIRNQATDAPMRRFKLPFDERMLQSMMSGGEGFA